MGEGNGETRGGRGWADRTKLDMDRMQLEFQVVGYLFLGEEFLDHGVPGVFEGFVHGEGFQGGAGYALEGSAVVADVQVEALDLDRVKIQVVLGYEAGGVLGGEAEDEFEAQGRFSAFDQGETVLSQGLPEGVFGDVFFFGIKGFLDVTVYGECVEGDDFSFYELEVVECFGQQ